MIASTPVNERTIMKELICFTLGVVIGVITMKNRHAVSDLEKELEREKARNSAGQQGTA
jgi:hypothetical protein